MPPCYFGGMSEEALTRLHDELVRGLVEDGFCPTNSTLALRLRVADIESLLRGLSDIHGVVLHPHVCEPWVLHPFSPTPTPNWVEGKTKNWWAPCV